MGPNKKFGSKLIHQKNRNVKLKMYFIQTVHYAILVAMVTNTALAFKQKTCYKGLNYIFIITTNFVNNFTVRKD